MLFAQVFTAPEFAPRLGKIHIHRALAGPGLVSGDAYPFVIESGQRLAHLHLITRLHQPLQNTPRNFRGGNCTAEGLHHTRYCTVGTETRFRHNRNTNLHCGV